MRDFHQMAAFYGCCGIVLIVFVVLIYSLIALRKSNGTQTVNFHRHIVIELLWTTFPFLILVALALPAYTILRSLNQSDLSGLSQPSMKE